MRHMRRLWQATDGVSAIEFALVAGFLAILLLGILDFGMGFWEQVQVGNAARAGAAYAVKNGYDSTNVRTAALNATSLSGLQASVPAPYCGCPNAATGVATQSSCSSTCPNSSDAPGTYVTVNAQVAYHTIFAWPTLPRAITLSSSATVRIN